MTTFSGVFFNNNKPNISGFIKPPSVPQGSRLFENAIGLYNRRGLTSVAQLLKRAEKTTLLGSRFSCMHPNLFASSVALLPKANHFGYIKENKKTETLVDKVVKLNLPVISPNEASLMRSVIEETQNNEETETSLLWNLINRITTGVDLQTTLLPVPPPTSANITPSNTLPLDEPVQSSRGEKLIRWIFTSHDTYGLAITVLHNFFDICCQKSEEKNFMNASLVPRIRYAGFAFSATAGVVYHVAIGVLFTPLMAATLGRKKEVNEIWYGYWAGASISAIGVFAGMFGVISGNYLIHKTMERSVPQFKRLLIRYLYRVQIFCTRLNGINFLQLRQEVKRVKTTAEMISVTQKLVGVARDLLPSMV
ncbi:MAG: hypothetical protein C5B45_02395 [Chlamydiae bacterium]|nr:MAG: hypothetical protein C5B45_02395 [Chlamydiota bacterium]